MVTSSSFLSAAVSPLEGFGRREWVCFERALVVRDMFTGGERTFLTQSDAQAFRAMIYAQHGGPWVKSIFNKSLRWKKLPDEDAKVDLQRRVPLQKINNVDL